MKKHECKIRDLWGNIKQANLWVIGIPEGKEKEQGIENIFEEMAEKFMAEKIPTLKMETVIKIQEAQRAPNKLNPNRSTLRHIIIKIVKVKDKERILKAAKRKTRS